jgi:uroporphyrinogen decarboxylase
MTDRDWIEEMMEHLTQLNLRMIDHLSGVQVDIAWWWEDMCFNQGPLMSPKLFQELMVPRYKEITQALKNTCGVDVNLLDCDGRIDELVPGWMEGGINCMFPLESIHTDPYRIREKFEEVLLFGGVNKIKLIEGKDSIDRELEHLYPLVQKGGYIPCVDHRVPPDVTLENYLYYLEEKEKILEY